MSERIQPTVENAPGHVWKKRKNEWVCIWQPRTDLVSRGYPPNTEELWRGNDLTDNDRNYISDRCQRLQDEMLVWGRGGIVGATGAFDGTLRSLIDCYKTDPDSNYKKRRYCTRKHYDVLTRRLEKDRGDAILADVDARTIMRWHEQWRNDSGTSMAHALIGMLRTIGTFGMIFLKSEPCKAMKVLLHEMRFEMGKPRSGRLLADHAIAIRKLAHACGLHSVALAQAFQFECILRQKDVIGEWVPQSEVGVSDVLWHGKKWMRGLRWEEIDAELVLSHTTSKREKDIQADLKLAPMVMEELERLAGEPLVIVNETTKAVTINRHLLPASGPIINSESTLKPYFADAFRIAWRKLANHLEIPKSIRNMDSRSGAISEAFLAEAPADHVRQSATHSDLTQTFDYNRIQREASDNVMSIRAAFREQKAKNGQ